MVLGIEMMARAHYNLFGDPAMPILIGVVLVSSFLVKKVLLCVASLLSIWKIRHENTAWHTTVLDVDDFKLPDWDGVGGASHDAFEMSKRITSETFRFKFLNYNRSWLVDQLPTILTPRTIRRSRPYLINQLAKVIQTLNSDISSDSENEIRRTSFRAPKLSNAANSMLNFWVAQAKRRVKLKAAVQPIIQRAKGSLCERCLSRKLLRVKTELSMEEMDSAFIKEYPKSEFDQVLWKQFWHHKQKHHTLCLPCISDEKNHSDAISSKLPDVQHTIDQDREWSGIMLEDATRSILTMWYNTAQNNIFGVGGRKRDKVPIDISDDDDEDMPTQWSSIPLQMTESSTDVAIFWLRSARARLQNKHAVARNTVQQRWSN